MALILSKNSDYWPVRRFWLALAIAIAIHEIGIGAAGFFRIEREPPEHHVPATRIAIERRSTPEPTPAPTPPPMPTPHTPPPVATPSTYRTVAAPKATLIARKQSGGSRGGPKLAVNFHVNVAHSTTVPVVRASAQGAQTVADTGSGTKPAEGNAAGTGAGAGAGNGAGNQSGAGGGTGGNGSGAVNADTPCGEPLFFGMRANYHKNDGSFDQYVRVELRLGNGQKIIGDFPYPWHYASEAENPFSARWQGPDTIPAQLPPPGFDISNEPRAVQLTLKYTLRNGITRFVPCPN